MTDIINLDDYRDPDLIEDGVMIRTCATCEGQTFYLTQEYKMYCCDCSVLCFEIEVEEREDEEEDGASS